MRDVAELLERKRMLLARREEAEPHRLAEIEREIQEIDEVLSQLESKEAPLTAPK
ncbi:hypothetical protein [Bradyrhizobium sp. DASA03120]|uniref:hypothetical protein n=1 Tax=Bradyrhizobium sp. SMVTL-02 TaxID=3395917 RepID=UPI003F6F343E